MKKVFLILVFCLLLPFFLSVNAYKPKIKQITGAIKVGVVDSSAPISFKNEKGEYEGIVIDMMERITSLTGLEFNYVPVDLSRSNEATTPIESSPQLVAGITYSESLPDERGWFLSDSLCTDSLVAVGVKGKDLSTDVKGKKVALLSGFDVSREFVELNMPDYEIVEYDSFPKCLEAVRNGKAHAAVYLRSCINYALQKPRYEKFAILPTYTENIGLCVAAFTEESQGIIDIINNGLSQISNEEKHNIALNYTVKNPYHLTAEDLFYKYREAFIVIIFLTIAIIAALVALFVIKIRSERKIRDALTVANRASLAKGNFMSKMSHEIRTPLNAIIGYNTISIDELSSTKTDTERRNSEMRVLNCLTKSEIASRHLLTIINDVLDMAAIESGKIIVSKEKFDFQNLVNSLTTVFYSQTKAKGIEFDVVFENETNEWFIGDQMRTNQILTNLISNAIKFTDSGFVKVYIKQIEKEKNIFIRFTVEDSGIGISEKSLNHIWEPFEQADSSISRKYGGTGLGLSITKSLIDLMGGTIEVSSTENVGTKFIVTLPYYETDRVKYQDVNDFSKINALVVDDDPSTTEYINLIFNRCKVKCQTVTSGADAITVYKKAIEENDPFTLCLIDWRMPKMDGLETIKRIKEISSSDIPIIVISAYDYSEIVSKAEEIGINMFISKPIFQSSLFDVLSTMGGINAVKNTARKITVDYMKQRVLVAEDNAMNMEILCRILAKANIEVVKVWNGKEAYDKFMNNEKGYYKAIIMDVRMPVLDGYQATKMIRESNHEAAKDIPIIAMTADAFYENVIESISAGMNDHISKPIDLDVLFDTLNKYLETK